MHFLKSVLKTTSRIPYWEFALSDPLGIHSAHVIIGNTVKLNKTVPTSLFPYITLLALFLLLAALTLSAVITLKQRNDGKLAKALTLSAVMAYAGLFFVSLLRWRIL